MSRAPVSLGAIVLVAGLLLGCQVDSGGGVSVAPGSPTPAPARTSSPTPASATPAPGNALAEPGKLVRLHIEADANPPTGEDCERLFSFAMASSSRSAPGRVVECAFSKTFVAPRYAFAAAPDGSLYLERVEVLLRAKASLPSTYLLESCANIREHLLPANQPAADAAKVVVCWQAPPLPSGTAGGSNIVWGGVPEDATQIAFPARTYCWQLVPYLGAPREVRAVPVQCVLD